MTWWNTALYDTCSLITLDKLLLERPGLVRHFPTSILALEESFTEDQLRAETIGRIRPRVTVCALPPLQDLAGILSATRLSKALAVVDTLVYATAIHGRHAVVTADKQLTRALRSAGIRVGNMALILHDLVLAKSLSEQVCENLLLRLVARNDFLLGTPTPTWAALSDYARRFSQNETG